MLWAWMNPCPVCDDPYSLCDCLEQLEEYLGVVQKEPRYPMSYESTRYVACLSVSLFLHLLALGIVKHLL